MAIITCSTPGCGRHFLGSGGVCRKCRSANIKADPPICCWCGVAPAAPKNVANSEWICDACHPVFAADLAARKAEIYAKYIPPGPENPGRFRSRDHQENQRETRGKDR